jgi:3-phenylpropionate/cinnamic acid dioxygenase small subunit
VAAVAAVTFEDWHAISRLMTTYAELVDTGRWGEVGAQFADATYRIEHAVGGEVSVYRGAAEVQAFCEQTRLYADGTPRTRHLITNVAIDVDDDRASATALSYATVLQQTDELPLQPIASGRYRDRFVRVEGRWRFAERVVTGFLLGDRREHVDWHEGTPEGAVS